jgi:hypothetical protein
MYSRTVTETWNVYEWSDLTENQQKIYQCEIDSYIGHMCEDGKFGSMTLKEVEDKTWNWLELFGLEVVFDNEPSEIRKDLVGRRWEIEMDEIRHHIHHSIGRYMDYEDKFKTWTPKTDSELEKVTPLFKVPPTRFINEIEYTE